jgi:succinate dehydrogenase / fumarate reductase cytochrome b subunit
MEQRAQRPVFLNLLRIRFPVGAICSIAHRVSGVVLALSMVPAAYLLQVSLDGPRGFALASRWLETIPAKIGLALFVWALAHHALAGVRHMLMDADLGFTLPAARRSAWLVNTLGFILLLATAGALLA